MKEEPPNNKPEKDKIEKANQLEAKSLGPVLNLEEYVKPNWWKRIFNSTYLKTDGDVYDDQHITKKEIDIFLSILNLPQDAKILDLCCGQGRHLFELERRGFNNLDGIDISHYLIQRAKTQAKRENANIKFTEGDARKLPYPPDTFDAVLILGNSFGYFEAIHDDLKIIKNVFRVLKPWGKLLIDNTNGEYLRKHFEPRSWEWIDKNLFVCRERSLSLDKQRLISREVVTHAKRGVVADQFYGERLYTRESLSEILKNAGFGDINFHESISPDSQRNQDLGMMKERLIVTSVVRKEWTPVKIKKELKNVVVIMGDPNKPDILKPLRIFDEDDFYTIDQMKNALRELREYQFTYLNNHDTLYQDLLRLKPRIDFAVNLCDEGFDNIATKELHIPSLLEMLGIPYTGSGPQCLAHCYDKSLVRGVAKEMGIPVPDAFFIKSKDTIFDFSLRFPVIVKPNFGDSSFGITQKNVAHNIEDIMNVISDIREKFGYEKPILVEEFLTGKDLTVGIIGNPPESYIALPITEEDYSALPQELPKIGGYESKWLPDSPYWKIKTIVAQIPEETKKIMIEYSLKLFERLDCKDYGRIDWRLDSEGNPKLLEVNPNPGWCWDGHLAKMSKFAGLSYADMLRAILKAAEQRFSSFTNGIKKEETLLPYVHK